MQSDNLITGLLSVLPKSGTAPLPSCSFTALPLVMAQDGGTKGACRFTCQAFLSVRMYLENKIKSGAVSCSMI
nr:MAG TPA: hypothetical protein [Inoviridae sp.]